jgi:hypothetical protein
VKDATLELNNKRLRLKELSKLAKYNQNAEKFFYLFESKKYLFRNCKL